MDISHYRKEYTKAGLNREDMQASPMQQFDKWFNEAQQAELNEPNAMSIATVSTEKVPSIRTVLLKLYDEQGLVFFTNYNSQKAQEINNNPNVSILFPWIELERQIRITGVAEKISKKESFAYFTSRPHGSQLGAWISPQSQVIESRGFLQAKLMEMKQKFKDGNIPLPNAWGGYRIKPSKFEFWQGRSSRLHDRFVYTDFNPKDQQWKIQRLAP